MLIQHLFWYLNLQTFDTFEHHAVLRLCRAVQLILNLRMVLAVSIHLGL
jgi:hypothetical protein